MIAGAQPGAYSRSHTTASGPWPSSGRGHVTLIAGAADSPSTIVWPRGSRDCHPGGGACPSIAGDRQLTVSRPAGRAVLAAAIRAGARVLDAARSLFAGDGHSTPRRPVGRAAPAPPDRSEARGLASQWMSPLHAGQSAAPPRFHCARARGRDGPGSGRAPHRPAGGPRPASTTVVAAIPVIGRLQTGRCGVLTRIPVGAAATAGPGRPHSSTELAVPVRTTRHGDEAAASSSCRFPVPFGVSRAFDCYVI